MYLNAGWGPGECRGGRRGVSLRSLRPPVLFTSARAAAARTGSQRGSPAPPGIGLVGFPGPEPHLPDRAGSGPPTELMPIDLPGTSTLVPRPEGTRGHLGAPAGSRRVSRAPRHGPPGATRAAHGSTTP